MRDRPGPGDRRAEGPGDRGNRPARREDFYWTHVGGVPYRATSSAPIFDQAFQIFWRDPKLARTDDAAHAAEATGASRRRSSRASRVTDALFSAKTKHDESETEQEVELGGAADLLVARGAAAHGLRTMSAAELAQAKKMIAELRLPFPRCARAACGRTARADASICAPRCAQSLREGGDVIPLVRARAARGIRRSSCCATSPGR